jgi:glycine cleavage system H protein
VVSTDPYGDGWLFAVLPSAAGDLLTPTQYAEKCGLET